MNFQKISQNSLHVFLCFAILLSGCASSNPKVEAVPLNDEIAMGTKIHAEILSSFYVYTDPDILGYINEVGGKLTPHTKRELPYQFTVLYDEKIYATSAPGGYVYITTGMMNFLQSEAEFAAILAHELGQVQYQDPRLSVVQKALKEVTNAGAAIAPIFGQFGMLAVLGLSVVNIVADAGHKSDDEKLYMADKYAVHYLMEAGYEPHTMVDVLHRFVRADNQVLPYFYDYYQTRPITEKRLDKLNKAFEKLDLNERELITRPRYYQEMTKGIRQMY